MKDRTADTVARTHAAYENARVRALVSSGALSAFDAADLLDLAIVALDQAGMPVGSQAKVQDVIDALASEVS